MFQNVLDTVMSDTLKLVNRRSSQLKLQENSLNTLVIKVTSSKDNVTVTVDNTVVSLSFRTVSTILNFLEIKSIFR